jgi:hypothetical protein
MSQLKYFSKEEIRCNFGMPTYQGALKVWPSYVGGVDGKCLSDN